MLVSNYPLTPAELIAAAEIIPPRSILAYDFLAPSSESTLVVGLCEGLLLLDNQLNAVRFSHLSVQEHLDEV